MGDRRKGRNRRRTERRQPSADARARNRATGGGVEAFGWTILAHPLFLDQIEKLVSAAEAERSSPTTTHAGPNAKLLAHLLDLAFDNIPRDPGNAAYRHGGTLGETRKHWFRGKTGNGRYRLFYRFQSAARIIVYAWVNDETTLRTYGSSTDAYAVFAKMLNAGNPPNEWDALITAANSRLATDRLVALAKRHGTTRKG